MKADDLYVLVQDAIGERVQSARPMGGGCVGEVYALRLENGQRAVAKVDRGATPRLDVESFMLRYLKEHGVLPVPAVLYAAPNLLIMEHMDGDSQFSAQAERHAAELLAETHAMRGSAYGLARPTLIGALHQPNPWTDSWVAFFRDERLLYMSEEALRERRMPPALFDRIRAFARRIDEYIEEPEHPSLLHGDVWTTNVLASGARITAFLDPAVYYGHPEIELAFITLFSTFGPAFFERYQQLRPIRPGFFETRRDIYNFYPLLVHARLFGASYLSGIDRTLARLGF
jgi:fructosamine-3-kinase